MRRWRSRDPLKEAQKENGNGGREGGRREKVSSSSPSFPLSRPGRTQAVLYDTLVEQHGSVPLDLESFLVASLSLLVVSILDGLGSLFDEEGVFGGGLGGGGREETRVGS